MSRMHLVLFIWLTVLVPHSSPEKNVSSSALASAANQLHGRDLGPPFRPARRSNQTHLNPVNWSDICVIVLSYEKRHPQLIHARDTWLKGVKHFFYSNKGNPSIPTIPLENHPGQAHVHWTGNNAGEYRWVPALHHANISCRPYKWLLVADDDSYLVLPGVLRFLQGKRHDLPLYLGYPHPPARGHKGAQCKGPRRRKKDHDFASCCVGLTQPCWVTSNRTTEECAVGHMADGVHYQRVRRGEPEVRQPLAPYWHYGGACAMISVGLMDMVPGEPWLECGRRTVCAGGDRRLGSCIWVLAHIGVTDITSAGLTQGKFGNPRNAVSKLLSFHRITPSMARQLYNSELQAGMRRGLHT
eukprot:GGOE01000412.1.p1 GENE.GGOE01000412.1~~GGOE01000412.1.p1  ORF type:complete len:356 (+),score=81.16 GGOE01000412.1:172-1239(+)